MMFTGASPCVPKSNSLVPARNSKIGLQARNALSNTGVVLLYAALALITSTWNQRLLRVHALRSGLARLIVM